MSKTRARTGFHLAIIGMLLNILLFLMKLLVGLISGSIAVMTDAMNNLLDASSSLLAVLGFRFSVKRHDVTHPHGHGRAEYLIGFIISLVTCATAVLFGYLSVRQIIQPEPIDSSLPLIIIIAVTVLGKLGLSYFYHHHNRRLNSAIFSAVARDSLSDALASSATILALILAPIIDFPIDGIIGLAIAFLILYIGFRTMLENVNLLLGTRLADSDLEQIKNYVLTRHSFTSVDEIDYHDYGPARRELTLKVGLNSKSRPVAIERDLLSVKSHLARKFHIRATLYWSPVPELKPKIFYKC